MTEDFNFAEIYQPMVDAGTKDFNNTINSGFVPNAEEIGLFIVLGIILVLIIGVIIHFFGKVLFNW